MPGNAINCRCSHSLAAICAVFASVAVTAFVAEDGCLDAGGRVSDVAWACELAAGASEPLWSHVSIAGVGFVFLLIGVPVYLVVNSMGRHWILTHGKQQG